MSDKLQDLYLKLFELKPILPGSITEQYNVCGKANCRCKDKVNPRKHGPQLKLGFSLNGKSSTMVIRKSDGKAALLMNENFHDLRKIQTEINEETLRIYREAGAESAYALIERALSEARAKALGSAPGTAALKSMEESRDKWKAKAKQRNALRQKDAVKIRDLSSSRDSWKEKANCLKAAKEDCERQRDEAEAAREKCEAVAAHLETQLKKLRNSRM